MILTCYRTNCVSLSFLGVVNLSLRNLPFDSSNGFEVLTSFLTQSFSNTLIHKKVQGLKYHYDIMGWCLVRMTISIWLTYHVSVWVDASRNQSQGVGREGRRVEACFLSPTILSSISILTRPIYHHDWLPFNILEILLMFQAVITITMLFSASLIRKMVHAGDATLLGCHIIKF